MQIPGMQDIFCRTKMQRKLVSGWNQKGANAMKNGCENPRSEITVYY
jgi:hypothetical protein